MKGPGEVVNSVDPVERPCRRTEKGMTPKICLTLVLAAGDNLETARPLPAVQTEGTVKGVHFMQEDPPNEIGQAIRAFPHTSSSSLQEVVNSPLKVGSEKG
jgi:hypothetical protein